MDLQPLQMVESHRYSSDSINGAEELGMLSNQVGMNHSGYTDRTSLQNISNYATNIATLVRDIALFCIPSFLRESNKPDPKLDTTHENRNATSSLDGLRGYAAFAVFNYHVLYAYNHIVFYGYGLSEDAAASCARPEDAHTYNRWFHQLPIVRLAYTGTWPISIFFVISGFALSYKALQKSQDLAAGTAAVSSALIRRPFRLYGPPIFATFITMLAIQLGAYENGRLVLENSKWVTVISEVHHTRFDTFGLQLKDWLYQVWRMLNIFWWGDLHNPYDVHLWTISAEFRCSLAVYLILPTYITIRPLLRRLLMVILIIYVYSLDRWDVSLFFCGLLFADTTTCRRSSLDEPKNTTLAWKIIPAVVRASLLGTSLLLLSAPDFCSSDTPGFRNLSNLIPSSDPAPFRFLPNLGGILLVALITHTSPSNPATKFFLNSTLPQYLGRISYSLYIVHGPLIHTVGYLVFPAFWNLFGMEMLGTYVLGFVAGYTVLLMVVIWLADVFWRAVDVPCVQLARTFHRLITD